MTQQDELVLPIFNEGGHFRLLHTILQDMAPELLNYPLLLQLMQHFVFQHTKQSLSEKQIFTLEELEQEIVSKMNRTPKENLAPLSTTLLGMQTMVDTRLKSLISKPKWI